MFPIKCSIKRDSLYTALMHVKAKVSIVNYSSKAVGFNVRGVGTFFFDTCANLGQLSLYNSKYCIFISAKVQSRPPISEGGTVSTVKGTIQEKTTSFQKIYTSTVCLLKLDA
jgi:hypothetical protein